MPTARNETPDRVLSLLGMVVSGDLGNLTCYRSKTGRIVSFAKTRPAKPPTLAQLTGRARMSFAAEQWRHFTWLQKWHWAYCVAKANYTMTGYNLWIRWNFLTQYAGLQTLERQTGVDVLDYITRTQPAIPPKRNIEPHELEDERDYGRLRYGRKTIIMPQNSTEFIPYVPVHHNLPDGDRVDTVMHVIGAGSVNYLQPQNNHWSIAAYTSTGVCGLAELVIGSLWADNSWDVTTVPIQTIVW